MILIFDSTWIVRIIDPPIARPEGQLRRIEGEHHENGDSPKSKSLAYKENITA